MSFPSIQGRPLFGKRVLVTRAREQAGALSRLLEDAGAITVELPTVEIHGPTDPQPFDRALLDLESYDWAVFTSANAVRVFARRLKEIGRDGRTPENVRFGAVGAATAAELRRCGLPVDYVPSEFVAEAVAAGLLDLGIAGKRVLLPRAEVAREALPATLREAGALVDDVAAYRTVGVRDTSGKLNEILNGGGVDIVTFTSSSTVTNLLAALGDGAGPASGARLPDAIVTACIGPITARTAQELGVKVDVIAKEYTVKGLVDALVEYFSGGRAE